MGHIFKGATSTGSSITATASPTGSRTKSKKMVAQNGSWKSVRAKSPRESCRASYFDRVRFDELAEGFLATTESTRKNRSFGPNAV